MSDAVTLQAKGVCEGVMLKGDWSEYHINVGRQYPLKLSTKMDDVKLLAAAAGQDEAVWTYTEREGGPNPHRPGENFKNRWLTNVVVGGELDPAIAAAAPTTQAAAQRTGSPSPEGRETSIERQVLVKAAIDLYPASLISTDDEWWTLLERLDIWMAHDRKVQPASPVVADPVPDAVAEQQAATVADDDDIPF